MDPLSEAQPTRRRPKSTAKTAGFARVAHEEPISRTLAMLNAALRVWEAKQGGGPVRSVWARRSPE
ncbi:MAG: hypothetical protein M3Y80_09580 [Verrucomicrobiota bacterium]|nr:hypothetical protein [Verrucomicrobiota bacterium]